MAEGNGRAWSADITDLGDKIVALTVGKAVELGDYLEQVHGIKAAAGGGMMMAAAPTAAAPAEKPAEQTEFSVILDGLADPGKKIQVIKVVRELTGCGLADGKAMVEGAPKPIKENVSKDDAATIKKKLEEAGAKVTVK